MDKLEPAMAAAILFLLERAGVHPGWGGWPSSEAGVLALTGANQDEAHEAYARLRERLPAIVEDSEREHPSVRLRNAVAGFLVGHPDAVRYIDGKRVYNGDFLDFIAAMHPRHSPVEHELFAEFGLDLYEIWMQSLLNSIQGIAPTSE